MKGFLKRVLKSILTVLSIFAFAIVASAITYFLQEYGMEKLYADLISLASVLFVAMFITTD